LSEVTDITEARKRINEMLKFLVEIDENLLGVMIVDEEGLPLTFYTKTETFEIDVGPEEEEALGGTIIDAFNKVSELISENKLNLGNLKKFLVEGDKGIAFLYPISTINGLLLLYGTNKVRIGFVWTIVSEIEARLSELAKIAFAV
jgi:predicted regulator of Ras-like GTPase activity (Roadblock/LC7/MglB family)